MDTLPSSCSQALHCELKWFFFSSQLEEVEQKLLNDGQVCRLCAALLCTEGDHWFALQTPRKTQPFIHTHPIQLFHPHDYITSHMAAGLLINRRMFISLPVFYRGGVLSLATGTASPGLTREGKLSRLNTGFTSLLRWCQKRALHHRDAPSACMKRGLFPET